MVEENRHVYWCEDRSDFLMQELELQIPEELLQAMGPDPNVVMLDQMARIAIMTSFEAVIQAFIFGLVLFVVLKLNDR